MPGGKPGSGICPIRQPLLDNGPTPTLPAWALGLVTPTVQSYPRRARILRKGIFMPMSALGMRWDGRDPVSVTPTIHQSDPSQWWKADGPGPAYPQGIQLGAIQLNLWPPTGDGTLTLTSRTACSSPPRDLSRWMPTVIVSGHAQRMSSPGRRTYRTDPSRSIKLKPHS